jgi:hypothetical protein
MLLKVACHSFIIDGGFLLINALSLAIVADDSFLPFFPPSQVLLHSFADLVT